MAHYPIRTIPFTAVTVDDQFWSPRIETNRTRTIPYDFEKCEETERNANFAKAAGLVEGEHVGIFFNDSDVFKVIEGASYSLHTHPDPELDAYLDDLIDLIAAAQEKDGYLYTPRTIAERNGTDDRLDPEREGAVRWSNLRINHELYNVGHLYEAAVAHFLATDKRTLLNVALKNADLIDQVFGPENQRDVPGHQEIEIGLAKLYLVTGEKRYLDLAKFFLDERGHYHDRRPYGNFGNPGYTQDHLPVIDQDEAVGHAVRAAYMYTGMADVAALTGDNDYIKAIDAIWENVVGHKLYLTGGIGARHEGEAFGDDFELPNATAYAETCAAIANIFWNQRMFQLHGDAKYIDVLERSLYNGFLSGIAFSGDRFFYTNPLAFDGEFNFNRDDSNVRMPWFNCSCCPTNVVRLFPSLGGYIYAQQETQLYVNLYIASQTSVVIDGTSATITQQTDYPWAGSVKLTVTPDRPIDFALCLRIPGWARGEPVPGELYQYVDGAPPSDMGLALNGEPISSAVDATGYVRIRRTWQVGDVVDLNLPMSVHRVRCNDHVEANRGKVALERGPLVYCAEAIDNGGHALDLVLHDDADLTAEDAPDLLNGIRMIHAAHIGALPSETASPQISAIPYYAWAHRGVGEMIVWFNREHAKGG